MDSTQGTLYKFKLPNLILIVLSVSSVAISTTDELSSRIEIVPSIAILNSTDTFNFVCNAPYFNESSLQVNITKVIPRHQISISTKIRNSTSIDITLSSTDYIGIFHLLCYSNSNPSAGTRADVIVKAAPGLLQLAEQCKVYEKEYIKCIIRAPVIARAIKNEYPPSFQFEELKYVNGPPAYFEAVEFLENESKNDYLVFKWRPTKIGEFPADVRMNMSATLSHFQPTSYYFHMNPLFVVKPKFTLETRSYREILLNYASTSSPAICERSITDVLQSKVNRSWSLIDSNEKTSLINNLLADTTYEVCLRCRSAFHDPHGIEECQTIKTWSKLYLLSQNKHFLILSIFLLLCLIAALILYVVYRKKYRYFGFQTIKTSLYHKGTNIGGMVNGSESYHRYGGTPPHDGIQNNESMLTDHNEPTDDANNNYSLSSADTGYTPVEFAELMEVVGFSAPPDYLPIRTSQRSLI